MAGRTWLDWWRTALTATAAALAVGRFAPKVLDVAPWPYVLLGCGHAAVAIGLLLFGAPPACARTLDPRRRTRAASVPSVAFTIGGVLLVTVTVVLPARSSRSRHPPARNRRSRRSSFRGTSPATD